jgi:hypothetical protein
MITRFVVGKISLYSVLLVLCALCLAACQKSPKDVREISNPNSPLLKLLMTKADYAGDWQWKINTTLQREITPTVKNNGQTEEASSGLWGFYNGNQSYATIDHALEMYTSSALIPDELDLKADMKMPKGDAFTPTLPTLGGDVVAQCVLDPGISEQDHRATCRVIVQYGNLASTFAISAIGKMDKKTLELILSEVLTKIDYRIQSSQ